MGEMKPKSLRIEDETFEKFKSIAAEIGGNQQETLELLISNYELQKGKENLGENKGDVEQFEKYTSALQHMFMRVLEDKRNLTGTVRAEFENQLKTKDTTIANLQEQMLAYKKQMERSKEHEEEAIQSVERLQENLEHIDNNCRKEIKKLEDALSEKEMVNKTLVASNNDLREKNDFLQKQQQEFDSLTNKVSFLENENLKFQKDILSLEKNYNNKIIELKEQYLAEINTYQINYKELLDKIKMLKSEDEIKSEKYSHSTPVAKRKSGQDKTSKKSTEESVQAKE